MSSRPAASAKKNFAFSIAFTAVNILYPLITFAYVSRIMGPALTGKINMATSLASYFALLASAAIPLYGTREIAKVRGDAEKVARVFAELQCINFAATVLASLLFAACLLMPGRFHDDWRLYAAAGVFIASNCVSTDWFFQGLEHFPSTFARNLVTKAGAFLLILILVSGGKDYVRVAAIGSASAATYNLWGLLAAVREVPFSFRGIRPGAHFRTLATLASATVLASAYLYLDGVLLGFLAGDHALGLYSAAIRITRTSHVVVMALTIAIIPRISAYLESGRRDEYTALGQKSIHTIFFLCFPICAILIAVSPHVVAVLAGPQFGAAATTLRYTMPLLPLAGFTNWLGLQILFPRGVEKALLVSAAVGAVANLSLNLLLIPRFAENGAAWSAVATEGCAGLVLLAFARRADLAFRFWDARATAYLALGAVAGIIAWLAAARISVPLAAAAAGSAAGGVVYLGLLWLGKDPLAHDLVGMALRRGRAALGRGAG